jgi:predicted DsbA family dithiol-disulfide isomerase|tara:strand:- start:874 stop:1362 length:489 start_codon:yes stop_codon:yes gene_type:complete
VNSKEGEDWKAWEQGEDYVSRGLWPLRGGIAAREQGTTAHNNYMEKILHAKHVERKDVRTRESIIAIAVSADLDTNQFTSILDNHETLAQIGIDHEDALTHGVFGTPTFVFEDGTAAFLKMFTPPEDESLSAFKDFMSIASRRKYFGELKRPQPPWPRGVQD